MKKNIIKLIDLEKADFEKIFKEASILKGRHKKGIIEKTLTGKTLGLIFDKPSTRTRISFETAMVQLGGVPLFINSAETQMVRNEPIRDMARVLSRYLDCIAIRTFSQDLLEEMARFSSIPIINALTDLYHPCQVLSDILTIIEHKGNYENLKITWLGDGNNVAHSWIEAASVLGLNLVLGCPNGFQPNQNILSQSQKKGTGKITVTSDPKEAVSGADVIYTDVWASMGQENEHNLRKQVFTSFQVNSNLVDMASKDVIIMHCLPAHRGEEITDEVLESSKSVVWDQAENKMHVHKAILNMLINQDKGK
ncbi:MAG: ornithine carbamoyltransferase [Desulfobacterales bacterium]|nr:ornithine carbamoyltransferase [Desulfobacterales bacterium]